MSIFDLAWWKDLAERVVRQEFQVLLPLALAVASTGALLDWRTAGLSALYTLVWTFLKNAAWQSQPGAPWYVALADRAGSAAVAAVAASLPTEFWGYDQWDKVAVSAAGAALAAVLMYFGAKPQGAVDDGIGVQRDEGDPPRTS
jgi:hypothetical protein